MIGAGTAGEILNQKFGRTAPTTLPATMGNNTYDALQMRLTRNAGNSIHVNVGYTFGK